MTWLTEHPLEDHQTESIGKHDYTAEDRRRRYAGRQRKRLLEQEIKTRLDLADERILHGEPEKALKEYDAIVRRAPRHVETLLNRGMLCEDLGLLNRAIQDYRKALELDPANEKAYELYCEAHKKWDESEAADELTLSKDKLRPSLKTATYKRGMSSQLFGWPANRRRYRRYILDPVVPSNQILHLDGIYIRRLFTGEAFRKKGCVAKFEIFLGICGLVALVGMAVIMAILLTTEVAWLIGGILIWTVGIILVLWLFEKISNKYDAE